MNIEVSKTYKLYINGSFQRTESGRYYERHSTNEKFLANMPKASRKDFRNAVQFARAAQSGWQGRSAYNKSQIVYRIAEMLQQEKGRFLNLLEHEGFSKKGAQANFEEALTSIIHLAGWCDKYVQVAGTVNPVASSHFNFSIPEPMGVICTNISAEEGLAGVINALIPGICGGNTVICLAENCDYLALDFSEVLANSDVPAGTINILTGTTEELGEHMARHMDVNALAFCGLSHDQVLNLEKFASENMKRVYFDSSDSMDGFYSIMRFQEIKTTWHPIDRIEGSASGY